MSVRPLTNLYSQLVAGRDASMLLRTDEVFNLTLRLGQVLKGKVLRHYEGTRYSVAFNGQERVVDSTVPMRVGDTVSGRVVAIDDKVHLQRIADSVSGGDAKRSVRAVPSDELSALFARYQVDLTQQQHRKLITLIRAYGGSRQIAPSALVLHKLGLPQHPELIQAVHEVFTSTRTPGNFNVASGPQVPCADVPAGPAAIVAELSGLLQRMSDDIADAVTTDTTDLSPDLNGGQDRDASDREQWQLGQWLLNIQGEGSLAHRFLRFPIWLDDRMVEVSMAVFSQLDSQQDGPSDAAEAAPLRHRKAVFSLQTDNLGFVEVEALVADRHLRLTVNVEHQRAAEQLAGKLSELTAALTAHDWKVDEIRYGIRDEASGVVDSLFEHHVSPDSLSCLL